jgi:uncharacterized OB-fold protein
MLARTIGKKCENCGKPVTYGRFCSGKCIKEKQEKLGSK